MGGGSADEAAGRDGEGSCGVWRHAAGGAAATVGRWVCMVQDAFGCAMDRGVRGGNGRGRMVAVQGSPIRSSGFGRYAYNSAGPAGLRGERTSGGSAQEL